MLESILIPFGVVFAAEFLDKSQLSVLLLAAKTKKHVALLLGVLLAFFIVDGIAIFFGAYISNLIPKVMLNILSGVLFIGFGIKAFFETDEKEKKVSTGKNVFLSGFTLIFIAEWGDKTQLASALFATKYEPIAVLVGVMAALTVISILAVFIGKSLLSKFDRGLITKIAGTIFIMLGISFLLIS